MKKLLPIVLIGVVILGVGAYLLSQNRETQVTEQGEQDKQVTIQQADEEAETFTGSLREMLGLGRAMRCTWSKGEAASGVAWVKGEMFYSEIEAQGEQNYSIFKDNCMWSWQEGRPQGVKMCFSPEEAEELISGESEASQQTDTGTSMPTEVQYNCQPTAVSDNKFNPPEDIEFLDVDQMMQGIGQ